MGLARTSSELHYSLRLFLPNLPSFPLSFQEWWTYIFPYSWFLAPVSFIGIIPHKPLEFLTLSWCLFLWKPQLTQSFLEVVNKSQVVGWGLGMDPWSPSGCPKGSQSEWYVVHRSFLPQNGSPIGWNFTSCNFEKYPTGRNALLDVMVQALERYKGTMYTGQWNWLPITKLP